MALPRHVLLASLALLGILGHKGTSGYLYKRAIGPLNSSNSNSTSISTSTTFHAISVHSEFTVVDVKSNVPRLSRCAAHVQWSLELPDSEATAEKLNAFKYDEKAQACTLGRLPYTPKVLSTFETAHEDHTGNGIYLVHTPCDLDYGAPRKKDMPAHGPISTFLFFMQTWMPPILCSTLKCWRTLQEGQPSRATLSHSIPQLLPASRTGTSPGPS